MFPWKIGKSIIFGILNERIEDAWKTGELVSIIRDFSRLLIQIFEFESN